MARRWPDFFIVGARKAGTTSLHRYLLQHPAVFLPHDPKEPNFFSLAWDAAEASEGDLEAATERYLDLFSADAPVLGEASTTYLYHEEAPDRLASRVPDARVVASLRDPITRAYSHYWMHVQAGDQPLDFHEAVRRELEGEAEPMYVAASRYADGLRRFQEALGEEAVLVFTLDDLGEDTREVVRDVVEHVGADTDAVEGMALERHNQFSGVPYGGLVERFRTSDVVSAVAGALLPKRVRDLVGNNLLLRETEEKPPMEDRTRAMLAEAFEGDVAEVEAILDRDLPELRASFP